MDTTVPEESIDIICRTQCSQFFDDVIGHIEDIVLSEDFQVLHINFLEKYWHCIEDTEENKLEYMDIFQEYINIFETFLIEQLCARIPNFNMRRFEHELEENKAFDDIISSGEIIELLHSFSSFETFKELMLDYRSTKEGHMQHLDSDILVTTPYSASDSTIPIGTVENEGAS